MSPSAMNESIGSPKRVENGSHTSRDTRPLGTIIMEKAAHGAFPTHYALNNRSPWLSVLWYEDPGLAMVRFSDGSDVVVTDRAPTMAESMGQVRSIPADNTANGSAEPGSEEHEDRVQKALDDLGDLADELKLDEGSHGNGQS